MAFAQVGAGILLANSFNRVAEARPQQFPLSDARGKTLMIAADMSGSHSGPLFETYSFVILDLDRNSDWLAAQQHFRVSVLPARRRMSYKALNDGIRRKALAPFLAMGDLIDGWVVTFAISKNGLSFFDSAQRTQEAQSALALWRSAVQERLLRVLHLAAFLASGVSRPGQNLFLIIDEDEIAANVSQLTQLTKTFGTILSNSLAHDLGHIRCGTAKSDDGTLALEDMLAYADMAAGSVCEIASAMKGDHKFLQPNVVAALPSGLSYKARTMAAWLSNDQSTLVRATCLIDLGTNPAMSAKMLNWHSFSSQLGTLDVAIFRIGLAQIPLAGCASLNELVGRNKRSALRHLRTLRRGALFRIRYGRGAIILAAQCAALIAPYGLSSFRLQADFNETADSFGAGDAVRGGPRVQVGHELIGKPEGP